MNLKVIFKKIIFVSFKIQKKKSYKLKLKIKNKINGIKI